MESPKTDFGSIKTVQEGFKTNSQESLLNRYRNKGDTSFETYCHWGKDMDP
jgi:hypothetical protein